MSQSLATLAPNILPAPMTPALRDRLAACLNKLDPEGAGYTIAADDAPSAETRVALDRRSQRLETSLAPAGSATVAKIIGALAAGMKKRPRSEAEADLAVRQLVEGLANLPTFALEAAAHDFLIGAHGDGWMPELADLRPHAVAKMHSVKLEKSCIDRLLHARVRTASSDPARKAQVLAEARSALKSMPLAGRMAEAERAGRVFDEKPPEATLASLARLAAEANKPIAPLSAAGRKATGLPPISTADRDNPPYEATGY